MHVCLVGGGTTRATKLSKNFLPPPYPVYIAAVCVYSVIVWGETAGV